MRSLLVNAQAIAPGAKPLDRIRPHALAGAGAGLLFLAGLAIWGEFAPLAAAVQGQGTVVVESTRKSVQHLEEGIVGRILVKDGEVVTAGESLVQLDTTKAAAVLESYQTERWNTLAQAARLRAEEAAAPAIDWPAALAAESADPRTAAAIAGQQKIFDEHRQLDASQIVAIQQKNDRAREEIRGLAAQAAALRHQLAFYREERAGVSVLVGKQLEGTNRLFSLDRQIASIEGQLGEIASESARAAETAKESDTAIRNLENDRKSQASEQLGEAETKLGKLEAEISAARDALVRTDIKAPVSGIVTDLKIHTQGAVIKQGQPILDIVPAEDRLVVSTRIRPDDIDGVRPGLKAHVKFLAFRSRAVPELEGTLETVSADRLTDERTGQAYYEARVTLDPGELAAHPEVRPVAGMQTTVTIETGKTTVAIKLLAPLFDLFERGMRDR